MSKAVGRVSFSIDLLIEDNSLPAVPLDLSVICRAALNDELEVDLKSFCAWPMALFLSRDGGLSGMPPQKTKQDYRLLFGKPVKALIQGRMTGGTCNTGIRFLKRLSMCEATLRLKRCALPVSDTFLLEALRKHGREISESDPEPTPELLGVITEAAKRLVDSIFSHVKSKSLHLGDFPLAKGGAVLEKTRAQGGHLASFVDPVSQLDSVLRPTELYKMFVDPTGAVQEIKTPMTWDARDLPELDPVPNPRPDMVSRILSRAIPILEPVKVRVITKSESVAALRARRLQVLVTRLMQDPSNPVNAIWPCLNDGTLNSSSLERFQDSEWLRSGDYSAATDTLRNDISVVVLDRIVHWICEAQEIGQADIDAWYQTLFSNEILYQHEEPDGTSHEWSVSQRRGQLMGSHLSFPILCIINAAVNWSYLDPELLSKPETLPMIVNGDDVALGDTRYASEGDAVWTDWVSKVGFTASLGKNYVSKRVLTINSMFFYRQQLTGTFSLIQGSRPEAIFNTRWRGQVDPKEQSCERTGGSALLSKDVGPGLAGDLHHIAATVGHQTKGILGDVFIEHNRAALVATRRPWRVSQDLGGLGLHGPQSQLEKSFTALMLRFADTQGVDSLPVSKIVADEITDTPATRAEASANQRLLVSLGWTKHLCVAGHGPKCLPTVKPKVTLPPSHFTSLGVVPERSEVELRLGRAPESFRYLLARSKKEFPTAKGGHYKITWMPPVESIPTVLSEEGQPPSVEDLAPVDLGCEEIDLCFSRLSLSQKTLLWEERAANRQPVSTPTLSIPEEPSQPSSVWNTRINPTYTQPTACRTVHPWTDDTPEDLFWQLGRTGITTR
jgi:hypothetical protein